MYDHIDLFSGIGGFSFGLEKSGIVTTDFVEYEPHLRSILKKHWSNVEIHHDIRTYQPRKNAFVMSGGFPCSDISIANPNGKGLAGERSGLWFEFKRCILEGRPKYVLIENVSALLGKGLGTILQDLAQIGYDATWTMLDSKFFGVPQRRRRVYILGVRDGIPNGSDPLENTRRSGQECRLKAEAVKQGFGGYRSEGGGVQNPITFFTRQRSDQFTECGLSSTLAKRDWKSYTDLVVQDGIIRRVGVSERLRLQGLPSDWLDGCGLTERQRYSANGMTVKVTEWLGQRLIDFDSQLSIDSQV
jgi:DNA (cytosine-5)-methyltransferase 1